jgi:alpha-amylase
MRKLLLIIVVLTSLGVSAAHAQDFIMQGCYWSCPDQAPGSLPDSATLDFWVDRMGEQSLDLAHAGFTHIWLPNLTADAPKSIQRLLLELSQHGLQPIAEISTRQDSSGHMQTQMVRLNDSLQVRSFSISESDQLSPKAYAQALLQNYKNGLQPEILIKGSPSFNQKKYLEKWIVEVLRQLPAGVQADLTPRIYDYGLREALRRSCTDSTFDVRLLYERSLRDASTVSGYNIVTLVNHPAYKDQNGKANDRDDIIENPLLAYAYILTNNQIGLPTIFYGDYFGGQSELDGYLGKEPLRKPIDQLIKAHREFMFNSTSIDYLNRRGSDKQAYYASGDSSRVLIFQMDGNNTPAGQANSPAGNKDVLVAINFGKDTIAVTQELNMANVEPGDYFTDILNQSLTPKVTVSGFDSAHQVVNAVRLQLAPQSYSVWVQGRAHRVTPSRVDLIADAYSDYVELTWEAAYERQILGYEIERSVSNRPYQKIGAVKALGSGDAPASYLYVDKDVFPNEQLAYRIKMLDSEGGYEFSLEQSTKLKERKLNFELLDSNRPDEKSIRVISNYHGKAELSVIDAQGKQVYSEQKALKRGENLTRVNLSRLPSGVYFITFSTEQQRRWSTKIVKL